MDANGTNSVRLTLDGGFVGGVSPDWQPLHDKGSS